ncbi:MAG TPA: response regulator transcription factor [Burkholderiaceae bacterium]|nr:response regulator transcription factor [Burkholderiaceae bacterium]
MSASLTRLSAENAMKILLVDDHALFRAGLRLLIGTISRQAEILETSAVSEALALLAGQPDIDLCLLDLKLKEEDGFEGIRRIKDAAPGITIVVVSGSDESATIVKCIEAGAMSFVPKSAGPEVLRDGLRRAVGGNVFLPSQLSAAPAQTVETPALTPRQLDVLGRLCRGLPNKLVCRELNLSENTVKEHITTIYRILDVRSRTQAVIKASQLGLQFPP